MLFRIIKVYYKKGVVVISDPVLFWVRVVIFCDLNFMKTAELMPWLHLPRSSYDLFFYDFPYDFFSIVGGTMSKSPFPYSLSRKTFRSSYRFTGIVASTILFSFALWQIWKNRKPVARRHITVSMILVRAPLGDRKDNAGF